MLKATAIAHPNIALIKYWGKRNPVLNLPATGSISITLEGLSTESTVEFDPTLTCDWVELNGNLVRTGVKYERVHNFLNLIRKMANITLFARVQTQNSFPTNAGLASSASGFAALSLAATGAAGLTLSPRQLSILSRQGSGSAARSVHGGFVEMLPGSLDDGSDSYAVPIAEANHWDLRCIIAITDNSEKSISSTDGMLETMHSSIFYPSWVNHVAADIEHAKQAIETRDFLLLAQISERSCLRMHASAMASDPGIIYWNPTTLRLIHRIRRARRDGLKVFFTIDAGPHIKVFCPANEKSAVEAILQQVDGVLETYSTRPGPGAYFLT